MPNQIVGQNPEMLELWSYLPDDILMHIFQFLPASSLLTVAQVSRCCLLHFAQSYLCYTYLRHYHHHHHHHHHFIAKSGTD